MHKGVIFLVKPDAKTGDKQKQAVKRVTSFLRPYQDIMWDWYVVGGRWTGLLDGYEPEDDPSQYEPCSICGGSGFRNDDLGLKQRKVEPTYTCNGCGTYDRETGKWEHGPMGPGARLKWVKSPHSGDAVPLSKCIDKVRKYLGNWEEERLAEYSKGKESFKNDKRMRAYYKKLEATVEGDEFSTESNVYDIENGTNAIPEDTTGYWAVIVDIHH